MHAEKVAEQCIRETGARGVNRHAREIALSAIVLHPDGKLDMRKFRKEIRDAYKQTYGEGSIVVFLTLSILVSLISNWIARWILDVWDRSAVKTQAFDALLASSPRWGNTLTSIRSQTKTPTGSSTSSERMKHQSSCHPQRAEY
jgi:hypothetical protein